MAKLINTVKINDQIRGQIASPNGAIVHNLIDKIYATPTFNIPRSLQHLSLHGQILALDEP